MIGAILRKGISPAGLTLLFMLPYTLMLGTLLLVIGVMEKKSLHHHLELELQESAKAYFEQILNARLWNARHGGVYVEVSEDTQPNPYLDVPNRDIVSAGGKRFTMVNPAYMTRQISEIAGGRGLFTFHITSLDPINPDNEPDQWEVSMLKRFQDGVPEGHGIVLKDSARYFRYMAPLIVEEQCLSCHAQHGYRPGDVRGGISVSIPMEPRETLYAQQKKRGIVGLIVVGLFSVAAIAAVTWILARRLSKAIGREFEAERLKVAMELAGAAAHELRQPMSIIMNLQEVIKLKEVEGKDVTYERDAIVRQCMRMDAIITKMLNITDYKTKPYASGVEIFDLGTETEETHPGTNKDNT